MGEDKKNIMSNLNLSDLTNLAGKVLADGKIDGNDIKDITSAFAGLPEKLDPAQTKDAVNLLSGFLSSDEAKNIDFKDVAEVKNIVDEAKEGKDSGKTWEDIKGLLTNGSLMKIAQPLLKYFTDNKDSSGIAKIITDALQSVLKQN